MADTSSRRPRALAIVLTLLVGTAAGGLFAFAGSGPITAVPGVPLDDAWTHLTFARNLARYGNLGLNPSQWGAGTTSLLWDVVLAPTYFLNRQMDLNVKVVGALLYIALHGLLALLAIRWMTRMGQSPWWAILFAVTLGATGMLTYWGLSGMETLLFLCLGLLAFLFFQDAAYLGAGIVLGAILLTRVEGAALILVLWLVLLYRRLRGVRPSRQVVLVFIIPLLAGAGYLSLNQWATGALLPTTMSGRRWLMGGGDRLIQLSWAGLRSYGATWYRYVERWQFFPDALPPLPWLRFLYIAANWSLLVLGTIIAILQGTRWLRRPETALPEFPLLFAWLVAHNLTYVTLFPFPSPRYQALNLVWTAAAAAIALTTLLQRLPGRRAWKVAASIVALAGLVTVQYSSVFQWRRAWDDYTHHINTIHVQSGKWLADNIPAGATVAAFDIGASSYFGEHVILDLGGLCDPAWLRAALAGHAVEYLRAHRATYLVLPEPIMGQGDLGKRLGLTDAAALSAYRLEQLERFEIARYPLQVPDGVVSDIRQYPAYFRLAVYHLAWRIP